MKKGLAVLVFLLIVTPSFSATFEQRSQNLSRQILCPTCQGQAIDTSNSQIAIEMRGELNQLLHQGRTDDEILFYFAEKYGENNVTNPLFKGGNLVLWLLPLFLFFALVLVTLKKFSLRESKSQAA